jgi:glutaredoxin
MADDITLIGAENCPKCATVKRMLEEHEIQFIYYDMSDLDKALRLKYIEEARKVGQNGLPVIMKGNDVKQLQEILDEN